MTSIELRAPCVSEGEITMLNFYRASELHGGLVLGQLARRVRDAHLVSQLLAHSSEEITHARLWTETISAVGGAIQRRVETYQSRYARALGPRTSLLQVLVLTQVFERRVYRHFLEHLHVPGTHPVVRATLERMLEEEKGHLSWVADWLRARTNAREVHELLREYTALDTRIYSELARELGWRRAA